MRFCPVCNNMLYVEGGHPSQVSHPSERIRLICHYCHSKNPLAAGPIVAEGFTGNVIEDATLLKANFATNTGSYHHFLTRNIEYDPSLPRVSNIPCPTKDCLQGKETPEVICIRYDQPNMRFLYYCVHCKQFWKSTKQNLKR